MHGKLAPSHGTKQFTPLPQGKSLPLDHSSHGESFFLCSLWQQNSANSLFSPCPIPLQPFFLNVVIQPPLPGKPLLPQSRCPSRHNTGLVLSPPRAHQRPETLSSPDNTLGLRARLSFGLIDFSSAGFFHMAVAFSGCSESDLCHLPRVRRSGAWKQLGGSGSGFSGGGRPRRQPGLQGGRLGTRAAASTLGGWRTLRSILGLCPSPARSLQEPVSPSF